MNKTISRILGAAVLVGALSTQAQETARVLLEFRPGSKNQVKAAVQGSKGAVHFEFDELNALALTVPAAAVNGLSRNPNVLLIEPDPQRFLNDGVENVPYGVDLVGATTLWDADENGVIDDEAVTGAGIKVGVIDSGVFTAHADFQGVNFSGEPAGWDVDHNGHGTHVVGTITAGLNGGGVVGVSPGKIAVHMVKVFGDNGNWIYASTLLNAANRAKAVGCKVISMSLGGPSGSIIEDRGFMKLYNGGTLLVAAAGNAGNTSTSYPAGYGSVISVGAIDHLKNHAAFSQQNSSVELAAPGVAVLSTYPLIESNSVHAGEIAFTANHVENTGRGVVTAEFVDGGFGNAPDLTWADKIVVIQRGEISFADKVYNAQAAGALGCIIYNNVEEPLYATVGDTALDLPAIGLSRADGLALLAHQGPITLTTEVTRNASSYEFLDGTSMATPHVSAVAALIWSKHPSKSNASVRKALTQKAEDLGVAGRDPKFGYGLVRAKLSMDYLGTLRK